jgi:alpha-1,3/alpha-1,6-mannosyltransferase
MQVLFYCHFPDLLLSTRDSLVKSIYRMPFDMLEEKTTFMADKILVNSEFTKEIVQNCFPKTAISKQLDVLYPAVGDPLLGRSTRLPKAERRYSSRFPPLGHFDDPLIGWFSWFKRKIVLSINRFERKKGLNLAIQAFAKCKQARKQGSLLVIAGNKSFVHIGFQGIKRP